MPHRDAQPHPPKRLKFEDLLTPEQKKTKKEATQQETLKNRFNKEVEQVTDAIVRSYNQTEDDNNLRYLGTIYTFEDYLDDYNQEGPHYHYWNKWLQEVMKKHPQLPELKIVLPSFDDYKGCGTPRIEAKLY